MSRSANAMQALTLCSRIEQENLTEEFANKNGTVLTSAVFAYFVISQAFVWFDFSPIYTARKDSIHIFSYPTTNITPRFLKQHPFFLAHWMRFPDSPVLCASLFCTIGLSFIMVTIYRLTFFTFTNFYSFLRILIPNTAWKYESITYKCC